MKRLFFLFIPILSFGQTISLTSSCSYYGEKLPASVSIGYSDYEAQTSLNKILAASGLPTNFTLVSGNIPNACATVKYNATSKSLERFIIYNPVFMNRIKNSTNDWSAFGILAHEVGHHLSGHSLRIGGSRPELEIEADRFSGFILQKLGASLDQATAAINLLSNSEGSATHPSKFLRISAIREGWFNAQGSGSKTTRSASKPNKIGGGYYDNGVFQDNYVEWKKTGANSFEISSQGYTFSDYEYTEFTGQGCTNKVVYMNDYRQYLYLEDFDAKPINSTIVYRAKGGDRKKDYVLIKVSGGYYILYNGKNIKVENAESLNDRTFGTYFRYKLSNGATLSMFKSSYDEGTYCTPLYFFLD